MRQVNALKIRNQLGEVLDMLGADGEPIVICKGRKVVAVLITPEQFERRFLDFQTEEKKQQMFEKILQMRAAKEGSRGSLAILREIRGYPS